MCKLILMLPEWSKYTSDYWLICRKGAKVFDTSFRCAFYKFAIREAAAAKSLTALYSCHSLESLFRGLAYLPSSSLSQYTISVRKLLVEYNVNSFVLFVCTWKSCYIRHSQWHRVRNLVTVHSNSSPSKFNENLVGWMIALACMLHPLPDCCTVNGQ